MELRGDDVLKVEYVSEDDAWNSLKEEKVLENNRNWQMDLDDNPLQAQQLCGLYETAEDRDSNMISKRANHFLQHRRNW